MSQWLLQLVFKCSFVVSLSVNFVCVCGSCRYGPVGSADCFPHDVVHILNGNLHFFSFPFKLCSSSSSVKFSPALNLLKLAPVRDDIDDSRAKLRSLTMSIVFSHIYRCFFFLSLEGTKDWPEPSSSATYRHHRHHHVLFKVTAGKQQKQMQLQQQQQQVDSVIHCVENIICQMVISKANNRKKGRHVLTFPKSIVDQW